LKLKVKALLVDLDGTLVDSRRAYVEAFEAGMKAIGRTNFSYRMIFEIPRRLEMKLPIDELIGNEESTEKFLKAYLATYYNTTFYKSKPFPNVLQTLERLSTKFSLALITMRFVDRMKLIRELKKLGLHRYFRVVVTALDVESPKPSPEALLKCAKCLKVSTDECAVVGDSVVDIRAGKRAGAKTIAVLSGLFCKEELEMERPNVIVNNFNRIPHVLL